MLTRLRLPPASHTDSLGGSTAAAGRPYTEQPPPLGPSRAQKSVVERTLARRFRRLAAQSREPRRLPAGLGRVPREPAAAVAAVLVASAAAATAARGVWRRRPPLHGRGRGGGCRGWGERGGAGREHDADGPEPDVDGGYIGVLERGGPGAGHECDFGVAGFGRAGPAGERVLPYGHADCGEWG